MREINRVDSHLFKHRDWIQRKKLMFSLIDTCLVVDDCLSLAIWEIERPRPAMNHRDQNAMTEKRFRAKNFRSSDLGVKWKVLNDLTRESSAITEQLVMRVEPEVSSELIGNGTYIKSLSFNFKSFTIQRLQNTASRLPAAAARLLSLHRPNRFLENGYQICLLLRRAFYQRERVDLVL